MVAALVMAKASPLSGLSPVPVGSDLSSGCLITDEDPDGSKRCLNLPLDRLVVS